MEKYSIGLKKGLSKVTITLLILGMLALTATMMPAARASNASITLSPPQGPVGTPLSINGQGFTAGFQSGRAQVIVSITFDSEIVAAARPDMFGKISANFLVESASPGPHTVTAADELGEVAKATFTVGDALSTAKPTTGPSASSSPTISLSPNGGAVGSVIGVSGSGFISGSAVTLSFDGSTVASSSADNSGKIKFTFTVPHVSAGQHSVAVTGGIKYSAATFTVTQGSSPWTGSPSQNQDTSQAGFWSPTTVAAIVIVAAVAFVVPAFFMFRRRGKHDALPEMLDKPLQPASPKKPVASPQYSQPATRYSQPSPYAPKSPVTARYSSPASYGRQNSRNTIICRNCKQTVRDDYNVCPYCRKKLR